jgi:DNA polymerase-3 subunit alpha
MDKRYADYVWEVAVAPQLGYAFSLNHSLPYSFVGIQTILLATQFSPIYWNTACLIVNSGAVDPELQGTTDYGKIAKALGAIQSNGIKIGLPDINKAGFGFVPDAEGNQILFGLKGLLNVGDEVVQNILDNRPYSSFYDFMNKVNPNKQAAVSLIKSGAFDKLHDRKDLMIEYLWKTCDKKKRITLQNMNGLIQRGLLPANLAFEGKVFEFNRYLKNVCKSDNGYYVLDDRAYVFIDHNFPDIQLEIYNAGYALNQKLWDRVYQQKMDNVRTWMKEHQDETLYQLNKEIFKTEWMKYGSGSLSSWEMEVMCFYYHEHELKDVNRVRYGISNFFDLPEEPIVEKTFTRGGIEIPIYRLHRIIGTCIAKNKTKGTVSLLTPEGVVTVKFRNEYFSMFDKQISERGEDGVKHVVEKSWFNRGSMIMVLGIRRGDEFVPKKYSSTPGHQLYKVDEMKNNILSLRHERAKGEASDE